MTSLNTLYGGKTGIIVPGAGSGTNFAGWVAAGATWVGPAIPAGTPTTTSFNQDQLFMLPFRVAEQHVVTHIVFQNTSGTRNTRAGLYRVDASAINLLQESADTALGGTGAQEIDITDTTLLPGYTYLAGIVFSTGAMTLASIATTTPSYADFPTLAGATILSGAGGGGYYDGHTYGALPSTLAFTGTTREYGTAPFIMLKVSS